VGGADSGAGRLLVADGRRVHRLQVSGALHELGHELVTVGSRIEARRAGPESFAAAVVGTRLEDGPGLDLVRELAAASDAPPVVALLDPGGDVEPGGGLAAGAVDEVVVRPEFESVLRRAVSRVLERRQLLGRIHELERQLEETTRIDAVSGVYTARYFEEVLARELQRARRFGGSLALLALRGPESSGIERTLGPHVRDRLLREIGAVLQRDLRLTDLAGRWPDGHFVVALTGTDRAGAERVAARLSGHLRDLTASLGLEGLIPQPQILAAGGPDELAAVELA
jgi:diguanylate cyclase (GGDEF)-like protein